MERIPPRRTQNAGIQRTAVVRPIIMPQAPSPANQMYR